MKTAIVYDWMDKWGGVERLLLVLHEIYPEADWYTSYVDFEKAKWTQQLKNKIQTSFIQKLPKFISSNRILSLLFYPFAFESFDFSKYDLVISVTSSFAKGIITKPGTKHVCILLTPTRFLWGMTEEYLNNLTKIITNPLLSYLRQWDYVAAQCPDKIISISQTVRDRCLQYYKRDSEVVYPPFEIEYWRKIKKIPGDEFYYLVVSRLEPYKRVDLAIKVFNKMKDKQLIVVGDGSLKKKMKKIAGANIKFLENISDRELAGLYSGAQALIMPQEEDFGYVALESQFFGCPVIAYGKGGALETVVDGKTGIFFHEQSVGALADAVAQFERNKYNLEDSHAQLKKFSKEEFVKAIQRIADSG